MSRPDDAVPSGLTTTSYAVLAQLAVRPWSTYELSQQRVRYVRYVWPRPESAVYREGAGRGRARARGHDCCTGPAAFSGTFGPPRMRRQSAVDRMATRVGGGVTAVLLCGVGPDGWARAAQEKCKQEDRPDRGKDPR
jgi:hypothetical protein